MKFLVIISASLLIFISTFETSVSADEWYYPMSDYKKRLSLKDFAVLIDNDFYKGKEHLFPYNRFYGYHAGVDLETLAGESNRKIPVYAITKGKVIYIGSQEGYGGVILQRIDNEKLTALYGHVKIKDLSYKVGDEIQAGTIITYLGDAFSNETSKERKHLHFSIYKGNDLYFRGHEESLEKLHARWIDPTRLLQSKGAIEPNNYAITAAPTISQVLQDKLDNANIKKYSFLNNLIEIFKRVLYRIGIAL